MSQLWLVAVYEYRRIVFRKSFLLALASVPLMISACVGFGLLMELLKNNDAPVGYVDHAGVMAAAIPVPTDGSRKPVQFIPFSTEDDAKAAMDDKKIQAYYVIAADYLETNRVHLVYRKKPGGNAWRQFYDFLQINLLAECPREKAHRAALVSDNVIVRSLDGRRELPDSGPTFGMIMPLLISLGFAALLVMSSGYFMSAVADEKENRTMEVLMTSISPTQFIGGKVLGIVAVNFTQLAAWAAVTALGVLTAHSAGIEWFQSLDMDWTTIGAVAVVAVPSFVLAAALMTAVGATVPSSQGGQAIGAVFFMLHFLPPSLNVHFIVTAPQGFLPTALSLSPFTALLTISLRNIFMVVPWWQVIASVAVQTLCAIGAIWLAGRAFRMGMLRYGQRLKWRKLVEVRSP
jgi:ABC-2 type transport system permease protein